jgi:ribosomal protein S18 acetylase RimI-like enzyme
MDPVSRITSFEPMGTHPSYRGLGLAKVLIFEGLKRDMKYNPALFYIGGAANTPAANRLYDSVGFAQKLAEDCWNKEI